jgi:hypothetical protein
MVFLTDANDRPWRDVQQDERDKFPPEWLPLTIHGVPDRNIECWLCAEPDWLGNQLGCGGGQFRVDDPKNAFESTMGISRDDRKEAEISSLVRDAPLWRWLSKDSFEDFYGQVRRMSLQLDCTIENLLDRQM